MLSSKYLGGSMLKDLKFEIAKKIPLLRGTSRIVAEDIVKNIETYMLSHLDDIARQLGISASSVSRGIKSLGFKGYPELQEQLRMHIKQELSPIARLNEGLHERAPALSSLVHDRDSLNQCIDQVELSKIESIASLLREAPRVHIMGIRSATTISEFLKLTLSQIRNDVFLIDLNQGTLPESLHLIEKKDVFFLVTFPRYSKPSIEVAEYAKKIGASVIVVTDTEASPAAIFADLLLTCEYESSSFFNSLVPALAIINAVLSELVPKNDKSLNQRLAKHSQLMHLSHLI